MNRNHGTGGGAAGGRGAGADPASPQCPHFGRCGGCSLLPIPIEQQLEEKRRRAAALLAHHLASVAIDVALPPRPPRHDRTTLLYPAQRRNGRLELGIYRTGSHELEPILDCRIQHRALTRLGVAAAAALRELGLSPYDETTGRGLVRAFRARVMPGSNELLLGVVTTRLDFPERARLTRALRSVGEGLRDDQGRPLQLVGIVQNHNPNPGNVLLGPQQEVLWGTGWQHDQVAGLRLRVSFASFYQHHRHADAILFRPALAMLGPLADLDVVDGYGGIGAFALRCLQAGARSVTLVESSPSACADARHNLQANGLEHGTVREESFGSQPLPRCDVLLADPPRAGLQEVGAAAVLACAPPRVLLVSCALESLARDLDRLAPAYRVAAVRLCDLFPHTDHVEALTLLVRRDASHPDSA